jgi:hypothetical protein
VADRHRNEFLAMLAHELRNPLAPICNALRLIQMQLPQKNTIRGTLGIMERQVEVLVRLSTRPGTAPPHGGRERHRMPSLTAPLAPSPLKSYNGLRRNYSRKSRPGVTLREKP